MPLKPALQNSFIGGLKTEFTGLNFPENACTAVDNCVFTLTGDVTRRMGIDFESGFASYSFSTQSLALNTYRWKNAGGDGETEMLVLQIGGTIYFFQSSNSTITSPLSTTISKNPSTGTVQAVSLASFLAAGSSLDPTENECQFADGGGYLFVYHPYCDPFYVNLSGGIIGATKINIQIRDTTGMPDNLSVTQRPVVLTEQHQYNLYNQGWGNSTTTWNASTGTQPPLVNKGQVTNSPGTGYYVYNITTGLWTVNASIDIPGNIINGQAVTITGGMSGIPNTPYGTDFCNGSMTGTVVGYPGTGSIIQIDIISININYSAQYNIAALGHPANFISGMLQVNNTFPAYGNTWTIQPAGANAGHLSTWQAAFNNYPSNADIWYLYKNLSGIFDPVNTIANVQQPISPAPIGSLVINAFNQIPGAVTPDVGIPSLTTFLRPQTGAWFQGRVFYAGCNASETVGRSPTGGNVFYTWTENIYFSQIITSQSTPQFGLCYQTNDPTDENFFDTLATDGGVVTIPGCGNVYKLFSIQNGLLVFASNGIWFITGSQGIGFTATDYTVTKISEVRTLSATSFVNVNGLPAFWNEEGIYVVQPTQGGGLQVEPITVGTILGFYNEIPIASKAYARGDYDPINYIITWVYRSTEESGIANRYQFDSALTLNTYNKAFYPYTIGNNNACYVSGFTYMSYPTGITSADEMPLPSFKYLTSINGTSITFSEEYNTNYLDFFSYDQVGVDAAAYFIAGYNLGGQAIVKFVPVYVDMFTRGTNQYRIAGVWDYADAFDSNMYSSFEQVQNPYVINYASGAIGPQQATLDDFTMYYRRHKIRGHGMSFQLYVQSVPGQPLDVMGWSLIYNTEKSM